MNKTILLRILVAIAVTVALWLVYRAVSQYTFDEIRDSVAAIPMRNFLAGLGFAALSYLCLTGFDALALRYVERPLPYYKSALASFTSLSIGHNVGVAALSSGAVRYRFYSRWGLSAEDVAKVILFCGLTVGLGLVTLAGLCLLIMPESAGGISGLGPGLARAVGGLCLAVAVLYILLAMFVRGTLKLFRWSFALPKASLAIGQIAVGTANFACVAACLHQMISGQAEAGYLETTTAYVVGNLTALVSHVPGGLGVLEATIAYVLGGSASIGALIAFRAAYFFIPLPLGLLSLLISEFALGSGSTERLQNEAR